MNNESGYIDDNILQRAIDTWGEFAQIEMIKEECLELALALQKLGRKRGDEKEKISNIEDEIADVKIMIKQAEKLFNKTNINSRVDFKMKRLKFRLDNKVNS